MSSETSDLDLRSEHFETFEELGGNTLSLLGISFPCIQENCRAELLVLWPPGGAVGSPNLDPSCFPNPDSC